MSFDAASSSVNRIVQYFNPYTQLNALKELKSDPAKIEEPDRRALATLALTGTPEVKLLAIELLGNPL